jgi:hypothetical protein
MNEAVRQAGPVVHTRHLVTLASALLILTACEPPAPPVESHPEWVIHSKVAFVGTDLVTPREPLPLAAFRLTFPYVSGDLYGSPTIGDFIHPKINADYTFEIDLNRTQADLLRSLQPTEFNEEYLRIDPPEARIARLTPQALEADGIDQVAAADWVDTRSNQRLMLVYVDRPARITGSLTRNGHSTHYNIRVAKAGYIWIGSVLNQDDERMYREVERPEHVILALAPKVDDSIRLPPPEIPPADSTATGPGAAAPGAAPKETAGPQQASSTSALDLRGSDSPRRAASRERGVPER